MATLVPFYREYELPWEGDEESSARFRKILRVLLIVFVLLGILFPLLPTPKPTATETEVPTRLARVMIEEKPKPPPPPPPVPKVEEKPKVEQKPVPRPPVDQKQLAHEKAQKTVNQFKDELADLREQMDLTPLAQTKNLSGAVQSYLDKAATGTFPTGGYIGDLANNGTGLAPYHQWQSKVPSSLASQLNKVKQDIISKKIKISSPSQPTS